MRLSRRAGFWTAALVVCAALWASAAPTVAYPLYAKEWGLAPTVTTAIFAAYPVALIPVLILFGGLSDVIGRRAAILAGLAVLGGGAVAFALAPDLGWVFAGRFLMGIGVGLALGPATASMAELAGDGGTGRASSMTTAASAVGLALSTLVGGALIQYAPDPMHLSFWVLVALVVVAIVLIFFLPASAREPGQRWRPQVPRVPRGGAGAFIGGALSLSGAYALGALWLSLGAQVARDLVHSTDAFVDGAILSLSAVAIGIVAVLTRRVPPQVASFIGPFAGAAGLGSLALAGTTQSVAFFLVSAVLGGFGYALMFSGGLGQVIGSAPAHHRAATLSAAYVVGYVVQAGTALGLGALATAAGLQSALDAGWPLVLIIGVAGIVATRAIASGRGRTPVAVREWSEPEEAR